MNVCKNSFLTLCLLLSSRASIAQEFKSGIEWPEPPIVTPAATDDQPPSDAIVLFDGKDLSAWSGAEWKIEDGVMFSGQGNLMTKQVFGDIQLHIEWSSPTKVKGNGQGRGNSGVFLMDRYEVQVLDSYDNQTYFDGQAGSVYKQTPPMVNAMRKPGEWNTYDIFWTAPTFKVSGDVNTPAYVTVVHNGVLLLNHFELYGPTNYLGFAKYEVHEAKAPIRLQDHGNPVRFRNIWLRELHAPVGQRTSAPYVMLKGKKVSPDEAAQQKADEQLKKAVAKAVKDALKEAEAARKKKEQEEKKKAREAAEKKRSKSKDAAAQQKTESKVNAEPKDSDLKKQPKPLSNEQSE